MSRPGTCLWLNDWGSELHLPPLQRGVKIPTRRKEGTRNYCSLNFSPSPFLHPELCVGGCGQAMGEIKESYSSSADLPALVVAGPVCVVWLLPCCYYF